MKVRKLFLALLMLLISTIALSAVACQPNPPEPGEQEVPEGPETGVYYSYVEDDEYVLTLFGGNEFTLVVGVKNASGKYELTDGKLTLNPFKKEDGAIQGQYDGTNITLTYNNTPLKFWIGKNYTVTFDNEGASQTKTVRNGSSVSAPDVPKKEGYIFLGWFKEDGTPFGFDAEPVTGNLTLNAKWEEAQSGMDVEYTVKFDLGYEGAENPEAQKTEGGFIKEPAVPSRSGYKFGGWWVSHYEDGERLAHKFDVSMEVKQNQTLFAVWIPNDISAALLPEVTKDAIVWNGISSVSDYTIVITKADGTVVHNKYNYTQTRYTEFDWDAQPAGDYMVTISGGTYSETRYYSNKTLSRVSQFSVSGTILKFNNVDNAERYYLTIECGNEDHNHDFLDNGPSTTYEFANCPMKDGKITFKVTAVGTGYAQSVSQEYVCEKLLSSIESLDVDEENEIVSWNEVENAAGYKVEMKCGNASHKHIYNGVDTKISYKECGSGNIVVNVTPIAKGYGSPAYTKAEISKETPSTPTGIKVVGSKVSWNRVEGASYRISFGNVTRKVETEEFDLSTELQLATGVETVVSVVSVKNGKESLPSDGVKIIYNSLDETLRYMGSTLYWTHVGGSAYYSISVNGEEIPERVIGENHHKVTLTKAGKNVISISYFDEYGVQSAEATLEVIANRVILNGEGGSVDTVLYKVAGDDMSDLPVPEKAGYTFGGWYNIPGGADSNGAKYEDTIFAGGGDMELYADWRPTEYKIKFMVATDEIAEPLPQDIQVKFGKEFTLPVPQNSDKTKTFIGWTSVSGNMNKRITNDNGVGYGKFNLSSTDENDEILLYPLWVEALSYTLSVDGKSYTVKKNSAGIHFVTAITIPEKIGNIPVTTMGDFKGCVNLEEIRVPDTFISIEANDMFEGCTSLRSIEIYEVPGNNQKIYSSENGALIRTETAAGTTKKTLIYVPLGVRGEFNIPEGITALGADIFEDRDVTKVHVPSTVIEIGSEAFKNCKYLSEVTFQNGKNEMLVYSGAFEGCVSLQRITLPSNFSIYSIAENPVGFGDIFKNCSSLAYINIDSGHSIYLSLDGVVFSKNYDTLIAYPVGRKGDYSIMNAKTVAAKAFDGALYLTGITMQSTVQKIEASAFSNCPALRIVNISNNLLEIGDKAFYGSRNIAEVNINSDRSKLQKIGEYAFYECRNLQSIVLPNSITTISEGAFNMCSGLKTVTATGSLGEVDTSEEAGIGKSTFSGCTNLMSVTIPGSVGKLGKWAFLDLKALKKVVIPDSVKIIGVEAFATDVYESAITVVEMGNGVEEIQSGAFAGCDKIVSITLPASLKTVAGNAFSGCRGIKVIYNLTGTELKPGDEAFGGVALYAKSVITTQANEEGEPTDPADKTVAQKDGFVFWFENDSATLVGYIGNETEIVLPDRFGGKNYSIGAGVFKGNTNIKSVKLGSGVTSIAANAFAGCTNLLRITLGTGLTSISSGAFTDCSSLFEVCNLSEIAIAKGSNSNGSVALNAKYIYDEEDYVSSLTVVNDYYIFDRINDQYVLIKYTGGSDAVLPDDVNGEDYTMDLGAFRGVTVTSIVFGRGVKAIPAKMFYNITSIKSVTIIGNGETTIGDQAFYSFSRPALTSLTIGTGVKSIGNQAFTAFNGTSLSNLVIEEGLETIGEKAFKGANISELTIPRSVTYIGTYAFQGCYSLKYLYVLGGGNTVIGDYAFNNCYKLTTASLGEGVKKIGASAFTACELMTNIIIPDSVTEIGDSAFGDCISLAVLRMGKGIENIGSDVFKNCPITNVIFAEGTKTIPDNIFRGCASLKSFVIPESITTIGKYAFAGTSIVRIAIPDKVVSIGANAFDGCASLLSITLGSGVRVIGNDAFNACETLYEVYNLSGLNIKLGETSHGKIAFNAKVIHRNASAQSILIVTDDGFILVEIEGVWNLVEYIGNLSAIALPDIGKEYVVADYCFYGNNNLVSVVIPRGVTAIGKYAFATQKGEMGSHKLENVTFSDTVKTIDDYAFYCCTVLRNVEFPDSLESIGDYAFYLCTNATFKFGSGLKTIGQYAFNDCESIRTLEFYENLQSIESNAFKSCPAIEGIIFHGSTSVRSGAFDRCEVVKWIVIYNDDLSISTGAFTSVEDVSLIEIYFHGTSEEWGSDITGFGDVYFYAESRPTDQGNYWHFVNGVPTKWSE